MLPSFKYKSCKVSCLLHERNKMKPTKEEPLALLSKNSAKTLLMRNAIDAATLNKETRQIQRERNSEQRLFLKKKEHILRRQSSLVEELTPKLRRKYIEINKQQQLLSSSSFALPDERTFSSRSRSSSLSSAVSLPDIYATTPQRKTAANKMNEDSNRRWKGSKKNARESVYEETCPLDADWKELRKCRYLRNFSTEK